MQPSLGLISWSSFLSLENTEVQMTATTVPSWCTSYFWDGSRVWPNYFLTWVTWFILPELCFMCGSSIQASFLHLVCLFLLATYTLSSTKVHGCQADSKCSPSFAEGRGPITRSWAMECECITVYNFESCPLKEKLIIFYFIFVSYDW
jgi:hypothetical protein